MNATAPWRQPSERCDFRGGEHPRKFGRQRQHLTQVCQHLVGLVQLHISAEADVLICCERTATQERFIVVGGKAKPGEGEIGQWIVLMGESRIRDALQVARAAASDACGFQHRHGDPSTREGRCGVRSGQSCSKYQRAFWCMRCGMQVPGGYRGCSGMWGVYRSAQRLAFATEAGSFVHFESGCREASPDIARRCEGGKGGFGPAQARHRVIEPLLPGARFPRRRKAIEVPGIDPGLTVAG